MAQFTKGAIHSQVQSECEALNASDQLPFRELLSEERIRDALERFGITFRERVFTPMVTMWTFLSQVVDGNGSCQDAVSRVSAERVAQGKAPCSPNTTSYCTARQQLDERVLVEATRQTGEQLHREARPEWLWKGHRVTLVDGSTVSMADTPENQAEYPQSSSQKKGLGFPALRCVVLLSLSVGSVLDCALEACRGKQTGEQHLFRQLFKTLRSGDIVLGDRLYDCYRDAAVLRARGVAVVFGMKQSRECDFRRGRRLGREDHVVVWERPAYQAARYDSRAQWEALPQTMEVREIRRKVHRPGFRTRTVVIITTLLDGEEHSAEELIALFAERWHCELDLRSIKRVLGMHHLKCKTPEMVRKELWTHLLAYNLIRTKMAEAAAAHDVLPRKLSFTSARNHLQNYAVHLQYASGERHRRLEAELLRHIARSQVGQRPGRKEPRAVKKRNRKYDNLTKPRDKARKELTA